MSALILQMRGKEDPTRIIEQQQYLNCTGLSSGRITFIDLFEQPVLKPQRLLEHDMLFVGGISRDRADETDWPESRFPFIRNIQAILRLAIEKKVPALLSCGGFEIAGDMLGAKTYCKEEGFELGVLPLKKTRAAEKDVFLGPVSDGLRMVVGHVKYFTKTPPGTTLLYYTNEYGDGVPIHAFKVNGAPFYAFQGHPETSSRELCKRVSPVMYRKHYFPKRPGHPDDEKLGYNHAAYQAVCSLESDTAEAQGLLKRFVSLTMEGAFAIY